MTEQILFSCVGTTDPARGEHDGGLMHIMRHYRPKAVCIFLTPEIAELDQKDRRYEKMLDHMRERWDGYAPDFVRAENQIYDASDLDELSEPLYEAFASFSKQYPDAEILINLSSGTPQMQMILSQFVLNLRYRTRGIQVKNFERKAGTTSRSNDKAYDVELELEFAELNENELEAENRCVEPKLFALHRQAQWAQVEALLRRRDYGAILEMKQCLSEPLMKLVAHLHARNSLNDNEAKKHLRGLELGFAPYPCKPGAGDLSDYRQVSEYFLMMKNFQIAERYTDFVLRLNPFLIRLQEAYLDVLLRKYCGVSMKELLDTDYGKYRKLSAQKLHEKLPQIAQKLDQKLLDRKKPVLKENAPSIFIYNLFLESVIGQIKQPLTEQEQVQIKQLVSLFQTCERLNAQFRNSAAHDLVHLTDEKIEQCIGMNTQSLVREIERALIAIYPQCDPALFHIYEKCNQYISVHH